MPNSRKSTDQPPPSRRPRRLVGAAVGVGAVHGVLLWGGWLSCPDIGGATPPRTPAVVHVGSSVSPLEFDTRPTLHSSAKTQPLPAPRLHPSGRNVPPADLATAVASSSKAPPSVDVNVDTASEPENPIYLPRHLLTRSPEPTAPLILPYPPTAPLGHWRAHMALYIDAEGAVRRVTPLPGTTDGLPPEDLAPLPPELEDSARQAYLQARFIPGERHGQAVASRMVVEVAFDADPAPVADSAPEGPPDTNQDSLKVATLSLR